MGKQFTFEVDACAGNCTGCDVAERLKMKRDHRAEAKDRFPDWTQKVVTQIMCKPLDDELDIEPSDPVDKVVGNIFLLTVSTTVLVAATSTFTVGGAGVAIIAALVSTGVLRDFQLSVSHEASHFSFFSKEAKKKMGKKWRFWNELILGLSTTLAFSANGEDYRSEHGPHHSTPKFMTRDDPDAALLLELGFKPGMSVRQLWWHLLKTAMSPSYHAKYFWARLRSNVVTAKGWRRVAGISWLATFVGLAAVMPFSSWLAIFMVWFPLWQVSALLQFCSEHPWLSHEGSVANKQQYAEGCHGRFCWAPLPSKGLTGLTKAKAWAKWTARMTFIELPARIAVIPSALSGHDWHHLAHMAGDHSDDWVNTPVHRQKLINSGDPFKMADREFYGIAEAINHVFKALSTSPQK